MFALHGRKVLVAALLATALTAPAWANDTATTTQQTAIGQVATNVASVRANPTVVEESYATVTNGRADAPRTRSKPPTPTASAVRQPSASYYRPAERYSLILGIGY